MLANLGFRDILPLHVARVAPVGERLLVLCQEKRVLQARHGFPESSETSAPPRSGCLARRHLFGRLALLQLTPQQQRRRDQQQGR